MSRTVQNVAQLVNTNCTAACFIGLAMQTPEQRLQIARERAGYASATDAARAFGWNENTYRSHENGARGLKGSIAERYAKAFRVSAAWLLTGEGEHKLRNTYPVWGKVGLGQEVIMVEGDAISAPLEHIELPFGFSVESCGALIAVGDSQHPRVKNGEVVLYTRKEQALTELLNKECIVKIRNGPFLLKTIRRGQGGLYSLESHNAPYVSDVEIEWAGEVIAIIPAGWWRKIV